MCVESLVGGTPQGPDSRFADERATKAVLPLLCDLMVASEEEEVVVEMEEEEEEP